MRIIADLHIHSHYSRATSPKLTLPYLERWARIKGIDLVGTGDCTHPGWLAEIKEQLEPVEGGFFRLKPEMRREFDAGRATMEGLPVPPEDRPVRFVLTGEISTIYSRGGRTRKVHHVVILPDFTAAAAFQTRLERMGNISSDGRPILGVDSHELFAALLDADERAILVPAHIWTPWFSALGANSGFDSIEECYGDLTSHIGAIETGLSSNPPMNWAVSALDRFGIISNSDAHSPEKLGREATIFEMEYSFAGLAESLSGGGPAGKIAETIEFFPQEGKYHYDGHRACGVVLSPSESLALKGLCPVCGKPLTQGVMRRVVELADRPVDERETCPQEYKGTNRRPYRSLIPLPELLAELLGKGSSSKKVASVYGSLIERVGCEFSLLLDKREPEIDALQGCGVSGEVLASAIARMRSGQVSIKPGYDGEYGLIHVFAPGECIEPKARAGLFDEEIDLGVSFSVEPPILSRTASPRRSQTHSPPIDTAKRKRALESGQQLARLEVDAVGHGSPPPASSSVPVLVSTDLRLDITQEAAVHHSGGPVLIVAGPGTGKTTVLALRIAHLVQGGLDSSSILAITFTNKAAAELRERIKRAIGEARAARLVATTFHSFCLSVLREHRTEANLPPNFIVLAEEEKEAFLKWAAVHGSVGPNKGVRGVRRLATYIEAHKRFLLLPGEHSPRLGPAASSGELIMSFSLPPFDADLDAAYAQYRNALKEAHALDFDDLIVGAVRLLAARPEILSAYRMRFRAIFVDEFQDVNLAQYALIRLLAPSTQEVSVPHGSSGAIAAHSPTEQTHLCVIGDPNQAIYGFRGSDRRFIERFLVDYPDATVYRLIRSFRCASGIIDAAGRLVGTELDGSGAAIALWRCEFPTEASEAEGIAREIDRLIGGTRFFAIDSGIAGFSESASNAPQRGERLSSLSDCAILIRAVALAPPIEKALQDHGIPYRVIGETPWWMEEPARSVLGLVRAAIWPETQVLGGQNSCDSKRRRNPAVTPLSDEFSPPRLLFDAERPLLERLSRGSPVDAVRAAIEILAQHKGFTVSKGKGAPHTYHESSLERLISHASLYADLTSFLDDLALGSPQDGYEAHGECVSLMTMHAAKGLEFDYVFVAGLEEGIVPFTLLEQRGLASRGRESGKNKHTSEYSNGHSGVVHEQHDNSHIQERIEEERRLLYVAMTRARVGLYLSWARSRRFLGRRLSLAPSRFLAQIEDLVPMIVTSVPKKPKDSQPELF